MNAVEELRMEEEADRLLKQHGAAGGSYPAYSEQYLLDREKNHRRGELSIEQVYEDSLQNLKPAEEIAEIAWGEIMAAAVKVRLSDRQVNLLELRRCELTVREIAQITGFSTGTVHRELKMAAELLEHYPFFGLWTVLAEVFRSNLTNIRIMLRSSSIRN